MWIVQFAKSKNRQAHLAFSKTSDLDVLQQQL